MNILWNNHGYLILCLFFILFKNTKSIEVSFDYGVNDGKAYLLNNGNIVLVGHFGIYTYDDAGTTILYRYDTHVTQYNKEKTYSSFGQFSEEYNSIAVICFNHTIFILSDVGEIQFNYSLTHDTKYATYYDVLPHIRVEDNYLFILGYINSNKKAYIQYFSFDMDSQTLVEIFNQQLSDSDYGVSCQFMNHNTQGEVLTCFYLNNVGYPPTIAASSFKIQNNQIEKITSLETSYPDKCYYLQSKLNSDRTKCLLCYIKELDHSGSCSVYDINENTFGNNNKVLYKLCGASSFQLSLHYFKQTKQYFFACSDMANAQIDIVRFNENFEILIDNNDNKHTFLSLENCYTGGYYSLMFMGNEYKLIGDFDCQSCSTTFLYSLATFIDKDKNITYHPMPTTIMTTHLTTNIKTTLLTNPKTTLMTTTFTTYNKKTTILTTIFNPKTTIPTTVLSTTQMKPTTVLTTTQMKPTTVLSTTQMKPTTVLTTTQMKPTTVLSTTQMKPTTVLSTTQMKPTTVLSTTQMKPTTVLSTTQMKPTTVLTTTQMKPTTVLSTTQMKPTTILTTNQMKPTTILSTTHMKPTTITKGTTVVSKSSTLQKDNKATTMIKSTYVTTKLDSSTTMNPVSTVIRSNRVSVENNDEIVCPDNCQTCEAGNENNTYNCLSCKENYELKNNYCIYKYNYYYDSELGEIIYLLFDQLCPERLPYEVIETKECIERCSNNEMINKKCKINSFSNNNINLITESVRSIINVNETTDSNYDVIIDGNNIIYEITSTTANNDHNNVSSIDFGKCEEILKKKYDIDYLLVFKIDIKSNSSAPTKVEYEVYNPINKQKLPLSLCENEEISVYVPLNLDTETNTLYDSMSQYGYDILDINNSFYNDICTPFTTDDGTDISLTDRQSEYFNGSIPLCESSCKYVSYNSVNGKAKCQCPVKSEVQEMKTITYDSFDIHNFLDINTISNIEIIKCYSLAFSLEGLKNNYGSLIIIICSFAYIVLIIVYCITERTSISRILNIALKDGNIENPPPKNNRGKKSKCAKATSKYRTRHNEFINKQNSKSYLNLVDSTHQKTINESKKTNNKKKKVQFKNYHNINVIKNANIILNYDKKTESQILKKSKNKKKNTKKETNKKDKPKVYPMNRLLRKGKNMSIKRKNKNKNINICFIKYTEYELNNLPYLDAIKCDKRSYFQYYWSLLKCKHLILFIFLSSKDYNLIVLKISLFFFFFSLYFTVNAFFFTDSTMHKIYEDKGHFDIISQLPHIFYSSVISSVINMLIRYLALSEKNIIDLKLIKDKTEAKRKTVELFRCLTIQFKLFYLISLLFMAMFWYYVSTFCAVYKNTQIILIKNTLTSFALTMIYPFALYLLPGIFRIPALNASKKDMEGLYKFSTMLALL